MNLFETLRACVDAYTLKPITVKITGEEKLTLISTPDLESIPKFITENLINYLTCWLLPADQSFVNQLITIGTEDITFSKKNKTLESLIGDRIESVNKYINIAAYLKPFQAKPAPNADKELDDVINFTYSGGGDDGSYDTEGYWLESNYWQDRGLNITQQELTNLTKLVEIISGDFNGEGQREGHVEIDLNTATIIILEGDEPVTLKPADYFRHSSYYQDMNDAIQPFEEITSISYLILDRGSVYYASDFGILGKVTNSAVIKQNALTTKYCTNHLSLQIRTLFEQYPSQLKSIFSFSKLETKSIHRAVLIAKAMSNDLTIISTGYEQVWKSIHLVTIPVETPGLPQRMSSRSKDWFKNCIEGLDCNELESTINLLAEVKAAALEIA